MGHERIGYLPKTKKWVGIVENIANFSANNDNIAQIAFQTTKNVRSRFKYIEDDKGVFAAFKYIILLSYSSKLNNASDFLAKEGIQLSKNFNLFDLTQSIQQFISIHQQSKEYSAFATQSMIDTVCDWSRKNQIQQTFVFDSNDNSFETWKNAANGKGFCEISRSFFANFTERYLKYFLEREASSKINNLFDRREFNNKLETYISDISKHAFETSKITQSFSAGWFNNNVKDGIPSNDKIQGFLSFAFQKINSELLREEKK